MQRLCQFDHGQKNDSEACWRLPHQDSRRQNRPVLVSTEKRGIKALGDDIQNVARRTAVVEYNTGATCFT